MSAITGTISKPKGATMTQGELINNMVNLTGLKRKEVRSALGGLRSIGATEMKKRGLFVLPGFAKFVVKHKAATKARIGRNPFTGEENFTFKAKAARKIVKARTVKTLRQCV